MIFYIPKYLAWASSYNHEVDEMRRLILSNPADVSLLKKEYYNLTGKHFRRRKGE